MKILLKNSSANRNYILEHQRKWTSPKIYFSIDVIAKKYYFKDIARRLNLKNVYHILNEPRIIQLVPIVTFIIFCLFYFINLFYRK